MRRWLKTLVPITILLLFVLIMTGDWYLKRPRNANEDVALHINKVREAAMADDWARAQADLKQLQLAWHTIIRRVQFSVERDEIRELTRTLARLGGALAAQDKPSALMELAEAEEHWTDLGK